MGLLGAKTLGIFWSWAMYQADQILRFKPAQPAESKFHSGR